MKLRQPATAVLLVACLVGLGGCATTSVEESRNEGAVPGASAKPSSSEIAVACGLTRTLELTAEGYHATRQEALTLALEEIRARDEETDISGIPLKRFVDLLTAALAQLPEAQRDHAKDDLIQIHVVKDGREFGVVEV